MAIRFPDFNYGGRGGNLIAAAMGAALSGNRDSFNEQRRLQRQRERFYQQQAETDAITRYMIEADKAKMSGLIADPSLLETDPALRGQDIQVRTSSPLGLIPGLDERDLKRMNLTPESVTVRYLDPTGVREARKVYNPLKSRFEQSGPLRVEGLSPEDIDYLNKNPTLWDQYVRAPDDKVQALARTTGILAERYGDEELALKAQEMQALVGEGGPGVTFSQLDSIRAELGDIRGMREYERDEELMKLRRREDVRAEEQLGLTRRAEGRAAEAQRFEIGERRQADIARWRELYKNDVDIWGYAQENNGELPPIRKMSAENAELLSKMEDVVTQSGGDISSLDAARSVLGIDPNDQDTPPDLLAKAEWATYFYDNFAPVRDLVVGSGSARAAKPAEGGIAKPEYKPVGELLADVERDDITRGMGMNTSASMMLDNFQKNRAAWRQFRELMPANMNLPEDPKNIDPGVFLRGVAANRNSAAEAFIWYFSTDQNVAHDPYAIGQDMLYGINGGGAARVPRPEILAAYAAIDRAVGNYGANAAAWNRLIQSSNIYYSAVDGAVPTESQPGQIQKSGEMVQDLLTEFGDDDVSSRALTVTDDQSVSRMLKDSELEVAWSSDQVRDRKGVLNYHVEAFEYARYGKMLPPEKQKKYAEYLKKISTGDYDDRNELAWLAGQVAAIPEGSRESDNKIREGFTGLKRYVESGGSLDGFETEYGRTLEIAYWMLTRNVANPIRAERESASAVDPASFQAGMMQPF